MKFTSKPPAYIDAELVENPAEDEKESIDARVNEYEKQR